MCESEVKSSGNPPDLSAYGELLKPRDLARVLGISQDRAYRLFHCEGFPKIVIGRTSLFVAKAQLLRWLGYQA